MLPASLSSRQFKSFVEDSVNKSALRTVPVQNRQIVADMESTDGVFGSADVTGITRTTDHREGTFAVTLNKSGITQAFASLTKPIIPSESLTGFEDGKFRFYIKLPNLALVTSVALRIGSSDTNYYEWIVPVASLGVGWNILTVVANTPTNVVGDGLSFGNVTFCEVRVNFTGAGDTLAGIIVDTVAAIFLQEVTITGAAVTVDSEIDAINPGHGDSITIFGSTDPAAYNKGTNQNVVPVKVGPDGTLQTSSGGSFSQRYENKVTVTDVDQTVLFGFTGSFIEVTNDDLANSIWINYGSAATATAGMKEIKPFESFQDAFASGNIHLIAAAGKMADARITVRA